MLARRVIDAARQLMPSREYRERLAANEATLLIDFSVTSTTALNRSELWDYAQRVMDEAICILRQYADEERTQ